MIRCPSCHLPRIGLQGPQNPPPSPTAARFPARRNDGNSGTALRILPTQKIIVARQLGNSQLSTRTARGFLRFARQLRTVQESPEAHGHEPARAHLRDKRAQKPRPPTLQRHMMHEPERHRQIARRIRHLKRLPKATGGKPLNRIKILEGYSGQRVGFVSPPASTSRSPVSTA